MITVQNPVNRRAVLRSAAGAALWPLLSAASSSIACAASASATARFSPQEVKRRIRGPIVAIPTSFTRDDEVDFAGVRKMVKLGLDHGITAYELTAGDSQYHALAYDEIKGLTRTLVEAVSGKGIAIAATNAWWTSRAIDYVRFAESVGADAVQVLKPPGEDDGIVEHYRRIADSTKLGIVLHGNFPLPLLDRLVKNDSIIAMKEDVTEKYMFDICRKYGQRLSIFGGGQKWRFLVGQPYGLTGYLSTFGTFAPQIALQFWQAVERKDIDAARQIMLKYDQPMFDFMLSAPPSFHACWRATLEIFGLAQRYLRKPELSCNDEQMANVRKFWDGLGVKPLLSEKP